MKVQRMLSYVQWIEQDIESLIYGRGIYVRWQRSWAATKSIKHIVFGQCDLKDLRLDAPQVLNRDAINCYR